MKHLSIALLIAACLAGPAAADPVPAATIHRMCLNDERSCAIYINGVLNGKLQQASQSGARDIEAKKGKKGLTREAIMKASQKHLEFCLPPDMPLERVVRGLVAYFRQDTPALNQGFVATHITGVLKANHPCK